MKFRNDRRQLARRKYLDTVDDAAVERVMVINERYRLEFLSALEGH